MITYTHFCDINNRDFRAIDPLNIDWTLISILKKPIQFLFFLLKNELVINLKYWQITRHTFSLS